MTSDLLTKLFLVASLLGVGALLVAGSLVERPLLEEKHTQAFVQAVSAGEEVYGERCGTCHETYDSRFFEYPRWQSLIDDSGCPATTVPLDARARTRLLDFFRGEAAGSEEEAETIRHGDRKRMTRIMADQGKDIFSARCASCHGHALFSRTHTPAGWTRLLKKSMAGLHRPAEADVADLGPADALAVRTFLASQAACGPEDARIFRVLVARGVEGFEKAEADDLAEVRWSYNYDKAMARALAKSRPVLLNLSIEGGT
jgi:cytochrome c5